MPIDFDLSAEQKSMQSTARAFAREALKPVADKARLESDPQQAFAAMKPAYVEAYRLGLVTGFLPEEYGGLGLSNVDSMIIIEELAAVDAGFEGTVDVNALALGPVLAFGTPEQKDRWLREATGDPTGTYISGYAISELAGTANFDHPGKMPSGLRLTAIRDKGRGEYVLNGAKYWPSNCGGWDLHGANLNVVAIRTDPAAGGRTGLSYALVPRGTKGVHYKAPIRKMGLNTGQSNWMEFVDCRIPEDQIFGLGDGATVLNRAFTWSGPAVGIAAVGIARAAFEWALDFAKTYTGGGSVPIIEHQAVGYALGDVAMKIEAARYFCWKVAHYLDTHQGEGDPYGAMAKVLPTESLVDAVYKCMQLVGVTSLDREHPMERFMRDVMVLPIFDGGNLGMQRRKIWGAMADEDFNPRGLAESEPFRFKKSMLGYGTLPSREC